jgi:hypothetical protein
LDLWKSVLWSDESKFEIFFPTPCLYATQIRWMDDLCMCGSDRETWRRCDGALLVTLSVIYLEFKSHLTSMATTAFCSDVPSHLVCIICFSTGQWPKTPRLHKGYLTKKESDGVLHQMTWRSQSPDLNPIEMFLDELDRRVKEKQPTSAQHMWDLLQDCWKSIPHEAGWENAKSVVVEYYIQGRDTVSFLQIIIFIQYCWIIAIMKTSTQQCWLLGREPNW